MLLENTLPSSWLCPPDPSHNYQLALRARLVGTGEWLLRHPQYEKFINGTNSMLWLSGVPGCGKTILSATAIEHIGTLISSETASNVLIFFFDFNDPRKQSLDSTLRSLISQLMNSDLDMFRIGQTFMERFRADYKEPHLEHLCAIFFQMLHAAKRTFIVFDALDEIPKGDLRYQLLEWIGILREERIESLHLLVTGRPEQDIVSSIRSHQAECLELPLEPHLVAEDIAAYVTHHVKHDEKLGEQYLSPPTQQDTISVLGSKAHGMFRWAALQIDEIQNCPSERQVLDALVSLPKDLPATYTKMMAKIHGSFKQDAIRLLQILVHSERPLTIDEAIDVIAIEFEPIPQTFGDKKHLSVEDLLKICRGFVTITEDVTRSNPSQRQLIQLSHLSVRDYFLSNEIESSVAADFTTDTCHSVIAKACMVCLLRCCENVKEQEASSEALWQYSTQYWSVYARRADIDPQMQALAMRFYSNENNAFERVLQECMPEKRHLHFPQGNYSNGTALYYASYAGQFNTCKSLIAMGESVEGRGRFGTVLQVASLNGYEDIVRLLLDRHAGVNAGGHGRIGTALQVAAKGGHKEIVQLLLDNNANVNAEEGFDNALHAAVCHGHEQIARILLEHNTDVNTNGYYYPGALVSAASHGHEQIVQLLLSYGASVNNNSRWGTALEAAATGGYEQIVQTLLKLNADVNAMSGHYGNALQGATYHGHEKIVQLLLSQGADVNANFGYFGTALQAAAVQGHDQIVKLLLAHEADANIQGGYYGTAIIAAADHGHELIVRLLISHDANVDANGGRYGTSLKAASCNGHEQIAKLLLERGADVNTRGNALDPVQLKLVPSKRAEKNPRYFSNLRRTINDRRDDKLLPWSKMSEHMLKQNQIREANMSSTALQLAAANCHEKIVQLLIDYGADVNAEGGTLGTALQAASVGGHENVVKLLVDNGAALAQSSAGHQVPA